MQRISIFAISIYQLFISPILRQVLGKACRFNPTCSEYTKQSIKKYGIIKGIRLGLQQVLSCHPFGK